MRRIERLRIVGRRVSVDAARSRFVHPLRPSSSILRSAFWASTVIVSAFARMLTLNLAL